MATHVIARAGTPPFDPLSNPRTQIPECNEGSSGNGGVSSALVTPFLSERFIRAMDDIGRYGHEKYGKFSFHHRREVGDNSRGDHPRTTPEAIAEHAGEHFKMHLRGELHDHFKTRKHQLAAVAFNAMMEFYFSGLEDEE